MESENTKALKKLAHGAGISVFFGLIAYGLFFLFKLIAARFYGPSDYGLFSLAETILGIFVVMALFGVHQGISRYIPIYKHRKEYGKIGGYLDFIFKIPIIVSIICALLLFIFAPAINSFFNFPIEFILPLRVIAFAIPFYVLNKIFWEIFFAEHMILEQNISRNLIERVPLFIGIIIILMYNLSIFYLVLTLVIPIIIAFFYNVNVYKNKIKFKEAKKKIHLWKEWINFSWPLFLTSIFAYFIGWTDNLVIGKLLNPTSLGIYAVVFSLSHFLTFFQHSFTIIFMPLISTRYAHKDKKSISFLFRKSQNWMFGAVIPLALLLIIFSKKLLELVYGKEYVLGALPLLVLIIGFVINIYTGLNQNVLRLHKKTKYIFKVNFIIAIFNLILNIFLINLWGIMGAAISTSISLALQNILFLYKAKQMETLKFGWHVNMKFLISGLISVGIAKILLIALHFNAYVKLSLIGLIYILLYGVFLVLFRVFDKDDIKIILAIEKRIGINLGFIKKLLGKFY